MYEYESRAEIVRFLEQFWHSSAWCNALTKYGLPCRHYRVYRAWRLPSKLIAESEEFIAAQSPATRCCHRHRAMLAAGRTVTFYPHDRFVRDHG